MVEYSLPALPYEYNALEPYMDEQTVRIHHDKHHLAYINGLNKASKDLEDARSRNDYSSIQAFEKLLAFHGSGHVLHTLFWENMCPASSSREPESGDFLEQVKKDFGSFESMKAQLSAATKAVEASGWGVLAWEPSNKRLLILTAENHQKLTVWGAVPLLVIDVWEHAYYLKYQNNRAGYVDNFWKILNWKKAEERFAEAQ
jgi:Fe-Mn family superoxide dismutase